MFNEGKSVADSVTDTRGAIATIDSDSRFQFIAKWSYGSTPPSNHIIHGDNLPVLDALIDSYENRVRCIYLDPPYNNGDTYEHYQDRLGHDEWLATVLERLHRTKRLLREDGSVWISIDDSEMHYLKVAADTVFGRDNFIGTIVWERRKSRENRRVLSRNHEYLLVYAKSRALWSKTRHLLPLTEDVKSRYKNPDNDPRGPWQSVSATAQDGHATTSQFYSVRSPAGKMFLPPKGRVWVYSKKKMQAEIRANNVWFGRNGSSTPRLKKFLSERKGGLTPETLWIADQVGTTASAKKHLLELFSDISIFDTPKPEPLLKRILEIATDPNDVVLDPYLGSGTFAATAHKMGRAYIGIEKGPHAMTHVANRLKQVIRGEAGGISADCVWAGGGSFKFYRFKK